MVGFVWLTNGIYLSCDWQQIHLRRKENQRGRLATNAWSPEPAKQVTELLEGHSHFWHYWEVFWWTTDKGGGDIIVGPTDNWFSCSHPCVNGRFQQSVSQSVTISTDPTATKAYFIERRGFVLSLLRGLNKRPLFVINPVPSQEFIFLNWRWF